MWKSQPPSCSQWCWCTEVSRMLQLLSPSHHTCTACISCAFPPGVFCHGIWGVCHVDTIKRTPLSHWEPAAPLDKQRRWGGAYHRPLCTTFFPLPAPHHDRVSQPTTRLSPAPRRSFESQGWSQTYPLHNLSPTPWQPRQKLEETRPPGPLFLPESSALPHSEPAAPLPSAKPAPITYLLEILSGFTGKHWPVGSDRLSGRSHTCKRAVMDQGLCHSPSTLSKTVPNIPFHTWSIMNVPFLMRVQYCTFTHWQRSSLNY